MYVGENYIVRCVYIVKRHLLYVFSLRSIVSNSLHALSHLVFVTTP